VLRLAVHPDARDPAAVRIAVNGDLDILSAPALIDCVTEQLDAGRRRLVLDLGATSFCDARGLAAMLDARERVCASGGALVLVGASDLLRRAITATGLSEALPVVADVVAIHRSS
jgi:anti-anti-sigma factor